MAACGRNLLRSDDDEGPASLRKTDEGVGSLAVFAGAGVEARRSPRTWNESEAMRMADSGWRGGGGLEAG